MKLKDLVFPHIPVNDRGLQRIPVNWCYINDAASHDCVDYIGDEETLYNPGKILVIADHDTPSGTPEISRQQRKLKRFSQRYGTPFHYGKGIGYYICMDLYVRRGDVVVGCGGNLCTLGATGAIALRCTNQQLADAMRTGMIELPPPQYFTVELSGALPMGTTAMDLILSLIKKLGGRESGRLLRFTGEALSNLSFADKITLCNLSARSCSMGAIVENEAHDSDFYFRLEDVERKIVRSGEEGEIVSSRELDGLKVHQVFIGGCCGGSLESLREAADALKGKRVNKYVRLMIAPATSEIYRQAVDNGVMDDLLDTGAMIMNQGCSACWAKSQGLIDDNEVFVTTGSVNTPGWAGGKGGQIYIAPVKVAAKCAITGNLYEN